MRRLIVLPLVLIALAPFVARGAAPAAPGFVRVEDGRFVADSGAQLILHGVNVVDKTPDWTMTPWLNEERFRIMRTWGFNCIRVAFTWASLEPAPGEYSERCLAELDKRVAWAKANGIYVFLDMHQDLYSVRFSDGAPEWATLTDGKPHVAPGEVWSDAYLTSPAVQTAMDNFYTDKPGPGGVGLQERYAAAWAHVAAHFADEPTVIGYDLMNEPFAGSLVPQAMMLMAGELARANAGKPGAVAADAAGVLQAWASPTGRTRVLSLLEDPVLYGQVLDASQGLLQHFEQERLMPLYNRVTRAIRQVDARHIIFLETNGSSNMGVYTGISPVTGADGKRDPSQAYAPHGYDLVTDTPSTASASEARVHLIFSRHGDTARRLAMPMMVGEWGAYYGNARALAAAQVVCRQFEQLLCGDTYWALEQDLDRQPAFQAICRPYPMQVSGTLVSYCADPDRHAFSCTWTEDPARGGETRIFVPATYRATLGRIKLKPVSGSVKFERAGQGSNNIYLEIKAAQAGLTRTLEIR